MHREQAPTTEPAARPTDYLRLAIALLSRDVAEERDRIYELIEQADDADQRSVCATLVEAALQLEDASFELEKAFGQFE